MRVRSVLELQKEGSCSRLVERLESKCLVGANPSETFCGLTGRWSKELGEEISTI